MLPRYTLNSGHLLEWFILQYGLCVLPNHGGWFANYLWGGVLWSWDRSCFHFIIAWRTHSLFLCKSRFRATLRGWVITPWPSIILSNSPRLIVLPQEPRYWPRRWQRWRKRPGSENRGQWWLWNCHWWFLGWWRHAGTRWGEFGRRWQRINICFLCFCALSLAVVYCGVCCGHVYSDRTEGLTSGAGRRGLCFQDVTKVTAGHSTQIWRQNTQSHKLTFLIWSTITKDLIDALFAWIINSVTNVHVCSLSDCVGLSFNWKFPFIIILLMPIFYKFFDFHLFGCN